jgi:hypothetical protein
MRFQAARELDLLYHATIIMVPFEDTGPAAADTYLPTRKFPARLFTAFLLDPA